jgi:hypothetical protein
MDPGARRCKLTQADARMYRDILSTSRLSASSREWCCAEIKAVEQMRGDAAVAVGKLSVIAQVAATRFWRTGELARATAANE